MGTSIQLIQPVVALVIWSMVMWLWMYTTRLPAIASTKMEMDQNAPAGRLTTQPPRYTIQARTSEFNSCW